MFKAVQKEFNYTQHNSGSLQQVFNLLCPVREMEWIDGWTCDIVHSRTGLAELDCVFVTPGLDRVESVWQICDYQPENFRLSMVRFTPGKQVVRISIRLEFAEPILTMTHIRYLFTPLNEEQSTYLEKVLPLQFKNNMVYWERAINHYLKTGEKLSRSGG